MCSNRPRFILLTIQLTPLSACSSLALTLSFNIQCLFQHLLPAATYLYTRAEQYHPQWRKKPTRFFYMNTTAMYVSYTSK